MKTKYLYVMGAESGAGKSTVCLGILKQLLATGFTAGQLAYIKPVTQCIERQSVALFCEQTQIAYRDLGCLIFRKGFSKDFIDGLTLETEPLLAEVIATITEIGKGKTVVLIDGVGDPSVGSVVGISNVDVAKRLECNIIFVGKPGIGSAIDNTVLCISFIQQQGLENIGLIFNKIPPTALPEIKHYLTKSLPTRLPKVTLLGFIAYDDPQITTLPEFNQFIDSTALLFDWLQLKMPD